MKKNLKPRAIMYPSPAVIASAYDEEGNVDACTLAFAAMCSHKPPCIMIAINSTAKRKTLVDILAKKEFTLAFPSCEQVAECDYLGIETGYRQNKIEKISFTTTKAETIDAPIINEFKLSLECRCLHTTRIGSHTQIIAEIVNIQSDEDILTNNKIDLKKLNPIVYDDVLYDYFEVGDKIARAFNIGRKFRK